MCVACIASLWVGWLAGMHCDCTRVTDDLLRDSLLGYVALMPRFPYALAMVSVRRATAGGFSCMFGWLVASAGLGLVLVSAGCAPTTIGSGLFSQAGVRATSSMNGSALDVRPRIAVFEAVDDQSANIYLSDLPSDTLLRLSRGDASVLRDTPPIGSIVHIHLFLLPAAGRTPIDFNANNFTVTHLVFAGQDTSGQPAVGVYGGGGFLLPAAFRGDLADPVFEGVIEDATLAFDVGTPSFVDRLDGARYDGKIAVRADQESVVVLAAALRRVTAALSD